MPRRKRKRPLSQLFGAARKARQKKLARQRRSRGRTNPRRGRSRGRPARWFRRNQFEAEGMWGAMGGATATKTQAKAWLKPSKAKTKRAAKAAGTTAGPAHKKAGTRKPKKSSAGKPKKAGTRKPKKSGTKKPAHRKDPKRVRAGKRAAAAKKAKHAARSKAAKKAARTKARGKKKGRKSTVAKKKRHLSKKHRAALRRAARRRARGKARRSWLRIRRRTGALRRPWGKRGWKKSRRPVKRLIQARRTIKYRRAYGTGADRSYIRRYRMRTNASVRDIIGGIKASVKRALPIALSMYGTRVVSRAIVPRIPGLGSLGQHASPVGALLMVGLSAFATKRIGKLAKYRDDILTGAGLNLLDVVLTTYAPASVKAYIGLSSDESIYDSALGEYIQTGEYLDTSTEMGEYLEVGAEEELGAFEEMGLMQELGEENIGTGIGTQTAAMVKAIPTRAMTAPVPSRSFTRQVPGIGASYNSLASLYTGIFAGGMK